MSMIDRTNGSRVGYSGTSIPNQAIEHKSYGSGTVREYKLTPEELEEVRQKYPATKRDKSFKKPVVQNIPTKEDNNMPRGRKPKDAVTEQQTQLLREKEVASAADTVSHTMLREYKASGERLSVKNAELKAEVEHWKGQTTEAVALAGKAAEEYTTRIESLMAENGQLQEELNHLITERDELRAEADGLYRLMIEAREAAGQVPEPASETALLDRSIAELTRARWIIGRLTASGE